MIHIVEDEMIYTNDEMRSFLDEVSLYWIKPDNYSEVKYHSKHL